MGPVKQIAESKKKGSMSRAEWEMLNEDKISKYSAEVDFDFMFDVKSYIDKRDSDFYLHVFVYHNGAESYYGVRGFRGSLRV